MEASRGSDKRYDIAVLGFAFLFGLIAGCAKGPDQPANDNHAPVIDSLSVGGGKPVIAEGAVGLLLRAYTHDVDGDDLSLAWSGPGVFRSQNDANKTVLWDVPADTSGLLTVNCIASDGAAEASRTRAFSVGRALGGADFGPIVGEQVRWTNEDAPFYVMTANVTIPPSYELYIGEGCRIYCDQNLELLLQGGLVIAGGSGDGQVIFTPYGTTAELSWWDGIRFESSTDSLRVERAIIRNAAKGLNLPLGVPQGARVLQTTFENCKKGIVASSTPLTLQGASFYGGETGVDAANCVLQISGCNFAELSAEGLVINDHCEGLCTGSFFDGQGPTSASLSGGSFVEFHENSFLGSNTAFLLSFAPGGSLDLTCNYWGPGATLATIMPRIEGWEDISVLIEPFQSAPGEECP